MLYLQGLSNLQLGNVANYLDPILRDEEENQDIKFLAAWATMSLAPQRPEKACLLTDSFLTHFQLS